MGSQEERLDSQAQRGLTITQQLRIGFILVVLLTLAAGGVLVWQLNRLSQSVDALQAAGEQAALGMQIGEGSVALNAAINRQLPAEAADQFVPEVTAAAEVLRDQRAELAARLAAAPDADPARAALEQVSVRLDSILGTVDTIIDQAGQGAWSAVQLQAAELDQAFQELDGDLQALQAAIQAAESRAVGQAQTARQAALVFPLAFAGLAIVAFLIIAWRIARNIAAPIAELTRGVEQIAAGNLEKRIRVQAGGEIGRLVDAFNAMSTQIRIGRVLLERTVFERTTQLQASIAVGQAATSILDPEELIRRTVNLISDEFGYYYAAIFLVDEQGRWADLQEATGEAGAALKFANHRLEIGGQSMVGSAIARKEARIALDVGEESIRFDNPLLPDTRSEIALPLVVGEQILGALDVQSTEAAAFSEKDVDTLQNMANQVAIALVNARLFQETQNQLAELNQLYQASQSMIAASQRDEVLQVIAAQMIKAAGAQGCCILSWDQQNNIGINEIDFTILGAKGLDQPGAQYNLVNYPLRNRVLQQSAIVQARLDHTTLAPAEQNYFENLKVRSLLIVPLVLRGHVIGQVELRDLQQFREFSQQQIRLVEALASQAAAILENSRILERAQRLAERERKINQITEKIHRAVDVESILSTTVREIGAILGSEEAVIRIGTETELLTRKADRENGEQA